MWFLSGSQLKLSKMSTLDSNWNNDDPRKCILDVSEGGNSLPAPSCLVGHVIDLWVVGRFAVQSHCKLLLARNSIDQGSSELLGATLGPRSPRSPRHQPTWQKGDQGQRQWRSTECTGQHNQVRLKESVQVGRGLAVQCSVLAPNWLNRGH